MRKYTLLWVALPLFLVIGLFAFGALNRGSDKYVSFAKCLGEKGMTFYGAYWCPHCTAQKKLFERADKNLPYVECAIPGSNELTAVCKEKGIKSFPTWIGPGEQRTEGELSLSQLAERSGCALPEEKK